MSGFKETWDGLPSLVRTAAVAGACVSFGMIINDKYKVIQDSPRQYEAVMQGQEELQAQIADLSARLSVASVNSIRLTYAEDALCTDAAIEAIGPERDRWCAGMTRSRNSLRPTSP